MIISSVHYKELRRIKNCQGCKWLSLVWCNGCCMYYLETGKRRPNSMADPNCKVREIVAPQSEIDAVNKKLEQAMEQAEKARLAYAPKWDTEKAKRLFDEGKSYQEIADAVCTKRSSVINYANKHEWGRRRK